MNVLALSISLTIGILLLIGGAIGNYVLISEYEDDKKPDLWRTYLSAATIGIGFLMVIGVSIAAVAHVSTLQKTTVELNAGLNATDTAVAEVNRAAATVAGAAG
jgi:uncharacterized BrkB/YihY/UPF0761 family membrane protein